MKIRWLLASALVMTLILASCDGASDGPKPTRCKFAADRCVAT